MIQEYKIIEAETSKNLEERVNKNLRLGWKLSGGMSTFYDNNSHTRHYVQGLFKEDDQSSAWR
jgi:hypothetical protein